MPLNTFEITIRLKNDDISFHSKSLMRLKNQNYLMCRDGFFYLSLHKRASSFEEAEKELMEDIKQAGIKIEP